MFQNLKAEMARKDVTRLELAAELGVSQKTISNWLCGKYQIPGDKIIRIANYFDCTTDYILGLTQNPK